MPSSSNFIGKTNDNAHSATSTRAGSILMDEKAAECGSAVASMSTTTLSTSPAFEPSLSTEGGRLASASAPASKKHVAPSHESAGSSKQASFFGREQELQHLRDIWRHINDGQPIIPAALVWGTSGTGKSELIEQFFNNATCSCEDNRHPHQANVQCGCSCRYVLRGKYDEFTGSKDPFSAIIQALDDFAVQLKQGSPEELRRIQEAMGNAFSVDADADADTNFPESNRDDANHDKSINQLQSNLVRQSYSAMSALITVVPSLSILFSNSVGASSSDSACDVSHASTQKSAHAATDAASVSTGSIPGCYMAGTIVDAEHDDSSQQKTAATGDSQSTWNRLCYIFIQFMKAISTPQRPVFLFLDDLQWSSAAGLELLASLLTDTDLHNFMLLGAIRQETDPHNHQAVELSPEAPLQRSFLDRLVNQSIMGVGAGTGIGTNVNANTNYRHGNRESSDRLLEQVTLGPLPLPDCTQWLSHLLHRSHDDNDLMVLASKIHQKTQGNVYFTLQAVEELKRSGIIVHNNTLGRWEWDLTQSTNGDTGELPIGDNIVAIIEMQLRSLPQHLQHVLSVAAYIRSTFDVHVLQMVLQYIQDHGGMDMVHLQVHGEQRTLTETSATVEQESAESAPWTVERVCTLLDQALLEGLVTNSIGETRYHFAHDRVQQAAHGLIPGGEVGTKLRSQIGHCLFGMYRKHNAASARSEHQEHLIRDVDSLLFIAADHLNSVPTKDHFFLVSFNLEVGQKALQMAARTSAFAYLQKASHALQCVRNPWSEHYETCLTLFQCRTEVELSLGNFEVGYSIGNEILKRARTLDEKLTTYFVMALALGQQSKTAESLSMSMSVARQLGESPRRFYLFHAMNDLMQIKAFFKNHTDEDIENLPILTSCRDTMAMKIMHEVGYRSFFSGNWLSWLVHLLKCVRMTFRYGITEHSAAAFAVLSIFFDVSNEGSAATVRCAGIALKLLGRATGAQQISEVHTIVGTWIYPYSEPFPKCISMLNRGYSAAMEAGFFDVGLKGLQSRNALAFFVGYKLQPLLGALETALQQYKVYNVAFSNEVTTALLMMTKYLVGAIPIDWEVIERNLANDHSKSSGNPDEVHRLVATYSGLPLMATLLRRHELTQRMITLYNGLSANAKGYYFDTTIILAQGISASALYQDTGKAKYKKELKRQVNLARRLVADKGRNTMALLQLLKAERLSMKSIRSNHNVIRHTAEVYDMAIAVAEKVSLTHICAIACEQAAEYHIHAMKVTSQHAGNANTDAHALKMALHESACEYMTRAVQYYNEWDCVIKVKDIQKRRSKYLNHLDTSISDAKERIVDMGLPHNRGFRANSVVPRARRQTSKIVAGIGNCNATHTHGSLDPTRSSTEREHDGSRISGEPSNYKSTSDEDEIPSGGHGGDDGMSVLTDGSR